MRKRSGRRSRAELEHKVQIHLKEIDKCITIQEKNRMKIKIKQIIIREEDEADGEIRGNELDVSEQFTAIKNVETL